MSTYILQHNSKQTANELLVSLPPVKPAGKSWAQFMTERATSFRMPVSPSECLPQQLCASETGKTLLGSWGVWASFPESKEKLEQDKELSKIINNIATGGFVPAGSLVKMDDINKDVTSDAAKVRDKRPWHFPNGSIIHEDEQFGTEFAPVMSFGKLILIAEENNLYTYL